MGKNKTAIYFPSIINAVSSIVSALSFVLLYVFHIIAAYNTIIMFFCLIVIILCSQFKNAWTKGLLFFAAILLFLSVVSRNISRIETKRIENSELISDATSSIGNFIIERNELWIKEALNKSTFNIVLIPSSLDINKFFSHASEILDDPSIINKNYHLYVLNYSTDTQKMMRLLEKYVVAITDFEEIKSINKKDFCICLPCSSIEVINGLIEMQTGRYQSAREHFEKADSLGNASGTYYLSKWYGSGYNCTPNEEKQNVYLKKAADNGSRIARVEWGEKVLESISSTGYERGVAEDLLQRASRLRTMVTSYTATTTNSALEVLNSYYRYLGYYKKAYKTTSTSYNLFKDKTILYNSHLNNCISLGKYGEALKIIKEGEQDRDPYCYFVHAGLLINGEGLERNYHRAEQLLRFAADTLNYSLAYRGLSDLYEKTNRPGADFWEGLFEVGFDNKVD